MSVDLVSAFAITSGAKYQTTVIVAGNEQLFLHLSPGVLSWMGDMISDTIQWQTAKAVTTANDDSNGRNIRLS